MKKPPNIFAIVFIILILVGLSYNVYENERKARREIQRRMRNKSQVGEMPLASLRKQLLED